MSISTKVILRTNKVLTNGEYPIMLRITINRQSQFVTTKKSSSPDHWDHISGCAKKSHPDFKTTNLLLKNITSKIDLYLLNAGEEETVVSFDDVKQFVLKLTNTDKDIKAKSLFSFFEAEIKKAKS